MDDPLELDLRGLKCPLPVLRTRKALRRLPDGGRLRVLCTDPLAVIDIPHLVREDGYRLSSLIETDGVAAFVITKADDAPEQACPFCAIAESEMLGQNEFAVAIRDKYPVRVLHTLILPRRHVADVFGTSAAEREAIHALALICRARILAEDATVLGFNYGSNVGAAAGQKVFHAHVHLIPRRLGEEQLPAARAD